MASKRGPSVLVTDARERPPSNGGRGPPGHRRSGAATTFDAASPPGDTRPPDLSPHQEPPSAQHARHPPMRHVSVDNVLRDASEIPSGQPRGPPGPLRLLPTTALSAAASAARRRSSMRRFSSSYGVVGGSGGVGGVGGGSAREDTSGSNSARLGSTSSILGGLDGSGMLRPVLVAGVPSRTTKISEKLVLLPETTGAADGGPGKQHESEDIDAGDEEVDWAQDEDEEVFEDDDPEAYAVGHAVAADDYGQDGWSQDEQRVRHQRAVDAQQLHWSQSRHMNDYDGSRPPRDEELDGLRRRRQRGSPTTATAAGHLPGVRDAEHLAKGRRTERVARLTAYCTAQAFQMQAMADFLRTHHGAKTKLYDDCLYTVYHLPLLSGREGSRVRSRPMLLTPGSSGKSVLDLEIERSERRDEHMGYGGASTSGQEEDLDQDRDQEQERRGQMSAPPMTHETAAATGTTLYSMKRDGNGAQRQVVARGPINRLAPDAKEYAELFVFSYGVIVFWNFSERQEKDILADLSFSRGGNSGGTALVMRPLDEADVETEEFHFAYSGRVKRPRVFNDRITLLPGSDHMVKLTISHAIAQSTKLCFFEGRMAATMLSAQHVPKRLALTGELNMSRRAIVTILGQLFRSRVEINLSSNVLDVPNFFWDAEPTLHPLYVAIREYLEIDPRIQVLNERCRVFLDLAEILADSVADAKMSAITWIIIVLIVVSICVTVTEVVLRFTILEKEKDRFANATATAVLHPLVLDDVHVMHVTSSQQPLPPIDHMTLDELRAWVRQLDSQERASVCGSDLVGQTFAGV